MSNNVSEFVCEDAGKLVVILRQRDHFTSHINPTARNAERVRFGKLNQIETKLHLVGRKVLD